MTSQNGYGKSKYEARHKNEKKARERKIRVDQSKDYEKIKEKKKKRAIRNQRVTSKITCSSEAVNDDSILESHHGVKETIDFICDAPDWVLHIFGKHWLSLREIFEDFNISLPELNCPSVPKYWNLFKESEIFSELHHILRMLITLGILKKINISLKGCSVYVSEPLRGNVTAVDILEKLASFGKLLVSKCILVYQSGNLELFFKTPAKSAYDDEYTFITSQKTRVDLGRKADVDEETYDRRVSECIQATLAYLNACKSNERGFYSTRLGILRDIQTSRTLKKKEGVRIKPYGIELYGGTSVGKSANANAFTRFVLMSNGYDFDKSAVVSINMQDKFQSEFESHHQGVIFDDMCNTTLEFTDGSPTLAIIMFLNNIPMAALNPNAELKGKIMINPGVVTATTNVKDLLSNQTSNEPASINRRFNAIITMTVKPEYCKPGTQMLDPSKIAHMAGLQFPTYATYTVEEARYRENTTGDKFKPGKTKSVTYVTREFEGKPLVDVEIKTLLRFLAADSKEHFAQQKAFVDTQNSLTDIPLCACGSPLELCGECEVLDSHFGIAGSRDVIEYLSSLEVRLIDWLNNFLLGLIASKYGTAIIAYLMRDKLKQIVFNSIGYYLVCVMLTLMYDTYAHIRGAWLVTVFSLGYVAYIFARFQFLRKSTIHKFTNLPLPSQYVRELSWKTRMKILSFLVSVGIWKILRTLVEKRKTFPTPQAARPIRLEPDAKPWQLGFEFWDTRSKESQYQYGDAGVSKQSRTISLDNLIPLVGGKQMVIEKPDGQYCNAVPIQSNVLVIPNHMVTGGTEYTTLTKVGGHTFRNMPLDRNVTQHIEDTDFALWWCPGAGLHKNLVPYYPKEILDGKKIPVVTVYNKDNELVRYPEMTAVREKVRTSRGGAFPGLKYTFPEDTFGGLCMATLIGRAKGMPFIAGHHLAGKGTTGAAGTLTRKQLTDAIEKLSQKPGVLISHSSAPFNTEYMGVDVGPLAKPHAKCPTNELGNDAKINIIGSHALKSGATRKSAVTTSLISPAVTDVMGIEKIHDKPKQMDHVRHKEKDLEAKTDTATRFDSELFQKAVTDYELQLANIPDAEIAKLGKIDDDANLCGLDSVLGINAMNLSTSIGFPESGPKSRYVEMSDRQVEGITCVRDVDPKILVEKERIKGELLQGHTVNMVMKAAVKDEPTKKKKDKVRVFAAANMPSTMVVREFYLTLAALFQRNKTITECAVGTVVQSPEWTELYNHIGKFGWDRAIAGDYAKFDGRMSPQFMSAAFKILIKLAERSGNYDEDDLVIMRGIATEITYPTYDYFGTLVQFMGSNPSGHPLTVIINSMVNSLYMRYCWYAIAKEKRWWRVPLFSSKVSLMTYGDDNIATVDKGYTDFNHTAIVEQLAKVGITYTMADKEAESVPFISLREASFLKHYAIWDEELGVYRSPVEEDSIAKMLHTHMTSKVLTMEQSSAEAIQNVALKYFEFGREVYEKRKLQLEEVARKTGIQGYVGPIMSYNERLSWYREKFDL